VNDRQGNEGYRNLSHTSNPEAPSREGGGAELGSAFGGKLFVVYFVQNCDGKGHR
jgi:hypothetical protein